MARYKLVFFSPIASTQNILQQLFSSSPNAIGKIGKYKSCAFVSQGTGQFVPGEGAIPSIGEVGKAEYVAEDRVEVIVNDNAGNDEVKKAVAQLKKVHPYEEVAYDVYQLEEI